MAGRRRGGHHAPPVDQGPNRGPDSRSDAASWRAGNAGAATATALDDGATANAAAPRAKVSPRGSPRDHNAQAARQAAAHTFRTRLGAAAAAATQVAAGGTAGAVAGGQTNLDRHFELSKNRRQLDDDVMISLGTSVTFPEIVAFCREINHMIPENNTVWQQADEDSQQYRARVNVAEMAVARWDLPKECGRDVGRFVKAGWGFPDDLLTQPFNLAGSRAAEKRSTFLAGAYAAVVNNLNTTNVEGTDVTAAVQSQRSDPFLRGWRLASLIAHVSRLHNWAPAQVGKMYDLEEARTGRRAFKELFDAFEERGIKESPGETSETPAYGISKYLCSLLYKVFRTKTDLVIGLHMPKSATLVAQCAPWVFPPGVLSTRRVERTAQGNAHAGMVQRQPQKFKGHALVDRDLRALIAAVEGHAFPDTYPDVDAAVAAALASPPTATPGEVRAAAADRMKVKLAYAAACRTLVNSRMAVAFSAPPLPGQRFDARALQPQAKLAAMCDHDASVIAAAAWRAMGRLKAANDDAALLMSVPARAAVEAVAIRIERHGTGAGTAENAAMLATLTTAVAVGKGKGKGK